LILLICRFDEDLAAAHKLKGDLAVKQAAMQADLRKKLSKYRYTVRKGQC
jgi:hypothetical protein